MTAHKHYDMIVAKASNMSLVLFVKCGNKSEWGEVETPVQFPLSEFEDVSYFLCLPQHKEVCLHWLNGGEIEYMSSEDRFPSFHPMNWDKDREWSEESPFMSEGMTLRKAPKIKKKWIAYCSHTNQTIPHPQDNKEQAENYVGVHYQYPMADWQFIEIEIKE